MRGMLIATDARPVEVEISDEDGLGHLQRLVGGYIEAYDGPFGDGVCLYVNEEGMYGCKPNRAVYATARMERAGFVSTVFPDDGTVREGDFCAVLFGDIVAVGFDPWTGEDRDLTDAEAAQVLAYFTEVSAPGSGLEAIALLHRGLEVPPHLGAWEECGAWAPGGLGFHRTAAARTEYVIALPYPDGAGWGLLHGMYDLSDVESEDHVPEETLSRLLAARGVEPGSESRAEVTVAVAGEREAVRLDVPRAVASDDDLHFRLGLAGVPEAASRRAILRARADQARPAPVPTSREVVAAALSASNGRSEPPRPARARP